MTTGNYNTAGNTKLHNFITVYATNYHYINHTITMNTTDHHNDQSCHNTIWQWDNTWSFIKKYYHLEHEAVIWGMDDIKECVQWYYVRTGG